MLSITRCIRGSFILNARVVPDWWQPFHREERHRTAVARIAHLRSPTADGAAVTRESEREAVPITLQEANELVDTYTRNHNAEDLSLVLQHIRETLQESLDSFHYQSLFRVFNYTRDKDNVEQLLLMMVQRGEVDAAVFARIIDTFHCLSPVNVLSSILRVFAAAQDALGNEICGADGCPLLTSVLHHVANSSDYPPTASLLVVVWMRALGVQLCDWDYVHIFAVLLSHADAFPRVRSTIAVFNDFPRGEVSPQALFQRLEDRGELSPASGPLSLLVEAMRSSLQLAGVPLETPVKTCVVNTRTAGLSAMIEFVVDDMASAAAEGKLMGNLLHCYHALALLQSTLRNNTAAVETLHRVAREVKRRESTLEKGTDHASLAASSECVHHHYLIDMGTLLQRVSAHTLQGVRVDYAKSAQSASSDVSQNDIVAAESYAIVFVRSNDEAREALRQVTESVDLTHHRTRLQTKLMFRRFVELCARHPKKNCKMTPTGLEERRKWGRYLDARDTSLALFGSAKQARDSMKHLFYNDNKMPELRSPAIIERDMNDTAALFKWKRAPTVASLRQRTSVPHVQCSSHAVPRHLWDPNVYNPYPHVMLSISPMEEERITDDIFQELWRVLMNPSLVGTDQWYLRDAEMYLLLMRCLIHRLDWEAAAHLTIKTMESLTYTYMMDHEVTLMFKEIGDPAGCLAFKVATKLFDGRILKDGQSKREKFHQEQFGEL